MKHALGLIVLGAALWLGFWAWQYPSPTADVKLTFTDGQTAQLADLHGKPVVLNFWSVNCPICIAEMADWNKLHPQLTEQGAVLLGVSIPQDPPPVIMETLQILKPNFPTLFDVHGELSKLFHTQDITPTTIILDREGKIATRMVGELDSDSIKATLTTL